MNRTEFEKVLQDYISTESANIAEHDEIRAILLPLVGKPINAQTLNKKRLGDKFRLIGKYGMYHIAGPLQEHLIGYSSSGGGSSEYIIAVEETEYSRGFEYFDACSGRAARERIAQIQATDKDAAFALFSAIAVHFEALRDLFGDVERQKFGSYHFPPYYDVLRSIYDDKGERSGVKLSDFYFIRK